MSAPLTFLPTYFASVALSMLSISLRLTPPSASVIVIASSPRGRRARRDVFSLHAKVPTAHLTEMMQR
jgi:hypothetical protein